MEFGGKPLALKLRVPGAFKLFVDRATVKGNDAEPPALTVTFEVEPGAMPKGEMTRMSGKLSLPGFASPIPKTRGLFGKTAGASGATLSVNVNGG